MLGPIAAIVFASAMALSLSVEADSFFHAPVKTADEPSEAEAPPGAGEAIADASDDSTNER